MPDYFPENQASLPSDDEQRSYQKYNQGLYAMWGDHGPSYFPEGSKPLPSDDPERSSEKINAILKAVSV